MENFAQRLVKLRKEKGYTQSQLAEKLGVSNKSVSRWETDEGYPDITMLVPLADALAVSVDALLRDGAGFRDIQKKDLEGYLPFAISMIGFIGYYILNKIGVSFVACIIGYFAAIYASHYMLDHHTDRKRMQLLAKINALFNFLVLQSFCHYVIILLTMLSIKGMETAQLLGNGVNLYDYGGVGVSFVLSIFVAAAFTAIIFFLFGGSLERKKKPEDGSIS